MARITSALDWIGRANAVAWLWSCIPASLIGATTAWLTHEAAQQAWIVFLAALTAFTLVSVALAAWRSHRSTSVAASSFKELRRRAYDAKLAELEGEAAARRKHAADNMFGIGNVVQQVFEEGEARRKGRLKRLEEGRE